MSSPPVFQQRHFVVIAGILAKLKGRLGKDTHLIVVKSVADELVKLNPKFNHSKFFEACDIER